MSFRTFIRFSRGPARQAGPTDANGQTQRAQDRRELRNAVTFAVYAQADDLEEVARIVDRLFTLLAKDA